LFNDRNQQAFSSVPAALARSHLTNERPNPLQLLPEVIELARSAGGRLSAEFARPQGPRGAKDKALIDAEVEAFLRDELSDLLSVTVIGEELPNARIKGAKRIWLVDPHDGTSAFLQGHRGSAVSIALLDQGLPVLGVVYAPTSPDRGPDLVAWAEGMDHLLRNGEPVRSDLRQARLAAGAMLFMNHEARLHPERTGTEVSPARFVSMPSIAYRLARVACGDGVAAVSHSGPGALDYAAGHALLRGAHGVLMNESGQEVTYSGTGQSHTRSCFGGGAEAVRELVSRTTSRTSHPLGKKWPPRITLGWPRAPEGPALDRAVGCLLGQVIGDSLGALVEFKTKESIQRAYPNGVRDLADGGVWDTLAGQPTDDTELALALARCLVEHQGFSADAVAAAYGRWHASSPFDIGSTTRLALSAAAKGGAKPAKAGMAAANHSSAANGSLMRVAPIGIAAGTPQVAAEWASAESRLSHPHPQCVTSCAAFAAAISAGISGASPRQMYEAALEVVVEAAVPEVIDQPPSSGPGKMLVGRDHASLV
jgi:fructose-1,6-bisphosphatase/inositol monophosphatase family enzyme